MPGRTSATKKEKRIQQTTTLLDRIPNNIEYKKNNIKRDKKTKSKSTAKLNFLTANNIKPISAIELNYITGSKLFSHGKSPEYIIKYIYPMIKDDIDIFLHSKFFDENTEPVHFLDWMLKRFDEVYDEPWTIEYEEETEIFNLKKYYEYWEIGEDGRSVGLRFMPELKKKNENLHGLLVSLLGLFYTELSVPFWFHDRYVEAALDSMFYRIEDPGEYEDNAEDIEWIKQFHDEYTQGEVFELQSAIENSNTTKEELIESFKKFKPKNNIERRCAHLLTIGIEFLDMDIRFSNFINITKEEMECGDPGTGYEFACLGWSYDDSDPIACEQMEFYSASTMEFGVAPFRQVFYNNEDMEPHIFPLKYVTILEEIGKIEELIMKGL